MSYIRTGLSGLSEEQENALLSVSPAEIRALPVDRRIEIAFQHLDRKTRKTEAFWTAVEGFATAVIPLMAFLGISKLSK